MLIDTHAHLNFADFKQDIDEVLKRSKEAGIERIVNVASSFQGCEASLALAERYEMVYASIGIHPHDVKEINEENFLQLKGWLGAKKVVAIGEVGLDFYRNLSPQGTQKEYFSKFIDLSVSSGLPLIIHSRQADSETLEMLRNTPAKLTGVVHCFSGSKEFLEGCLDLGMYISFTCNITYKKADNLRELVAKVPEERLLLETDCPFLPPEGLRGKRNEPVNVIVLAELLAKIRNSSVESIAASTTANAKRLFKL